MATIDEIFDTMATEAEPTNEFLVIDPDTRQILVPEAEQIFGVEGDTKSERKYFTCPRYVGDNLDLASCFLSIKFRNANGEKDEYLVEDVTATADTVTFSWNLSSKVVAYKGPVQFRVYADTGAGQDWGTTLATGTSLEGLETDDATVEAETSDVVAQLRTTIARETAAVETEGTAQIQNVRAAAAAATTDAQDQIDAKGTATLASIPADYTTLAGKVNEQANAIKGRLSGAVIRADDVSPVEHYPTVRVHGKNLLVPNHASFTSSGYTITLNDDGSVTITGSASTTSSIYLSLALRTGNDSENRRIKLKAGRKYIMSAYKDGVERAVSVRTILSDGRTLWKSTNKWHDSDDPSQDREIVQVYVESNGHEMGDNSLCGTYRVQLEEGEAVTDWVPYIDPATVTVRRYGKNLAPCLEGPLTVNGLTVTPGGNGGFTISGAVSGTDPQGILYVTPLGADIRLKAGQAYTLKLYKDGELYANTVGTRVVYEDSGTIVWNTLGNVDEERILNYAYLFHGSLAAGDTSLCGKYQLQLEASTKATTFEPYQAPQEINALENGTVGGLTSLTPTMTLLTDKAGVTVECEYNRDTNAVYAELLEKIAALGG